MKTLRLLLIASVLTLTCSALAVESDRDRREAYSMEEAMRLFRSQDYESAARAFRTLVNNEQVAAFAWFQLAASLHHMGRYQESIAANEEAAKFPTMRASATYNLACSFSLMGDTKEAAKHLSRSIELGFLDFDLMSVDPDLENLRKIDGITLPEQNEYTRFEAGNRVQIDYTIKLPRDYEQSETYPVALVFSGGSQGHRSADWAFNKIVSDEGMGSGWIVICPAAPEDGWVSLASHSAFNEFLDELRLSHNIEGEKIHLVGVGNGGFIASVYAGIAPGKFHSLTLISFQAWGTMGREQIHDFPRLPLLLVAGSADQPAAQDTREVQGRMLRAGIEANILIVNGDGYTLPSLPEGMLLGQIGDRFREAL